MEIRIQDVHFDATEALKSFIQKKVSKLEQYYDGIIAAEVTLKVVKPETAANKEAQIRLVVAGQDLFASKTSDTFEEAIDGNVDALQKQLIKFKEKIRAK
ncbi:MAG: ribosome-associated translation inhibitor RaiA [Bacteroidales bacterium]|nr:ribosome-associated translation inhibitor RaiA [Bacteroidales bacterium]MBQ7945591.1 ribosome-associated translation inhibitor RaiA [Bacteroidales bacterium]